MPHLAQLDSVHIRRAGDHAVVEYLDQPVRITVRLARSGERRSDQELVDCCNRHLLALAEGRLAAPAVVWDAAGGCWRPLAAGLASAPLVLLIDDLGGT